jgi:hypothetical protein
MRQKITKNTLNIIDNRVINKIKKAKGGSLFFIDGFINLGSAKAINKALEHLVENPEGI